MDDEAHGCPPDAERKQGTREQVDAEDKCEEPEAVGLQVMGDEQGEDDLRTPLFYERFFHAIYHGLPYISGDPDSMQT